MSEVTHFYASFWIFYIRFFFYVLCDPQNFCRVSRWFFHVNLTFRLCFTILFWHSCMESGFYILTQYSKFCLRRFLNYSYFVFFHLIFSDFLCSSYVFRHGSFRVFYSLKDLIFYRIMESRCLIWIFRKIYFRKECIAEKKCQNNKRKNLLLLLPRIEIQAIIILPKRRRESIFSPEIWKCI